MFGVCRDIQVPARGWIHEIRLALGMSADALAQRVGVTQTTALKFEQSEIAKSISLRSLEKVGEAVGCKLVYALLLRESLEATWRERAREMAARIVSRLEQNMRLEAQGNSEVTRAEQVEDVASELVRTLSAQLCGRNDQSHLFAGCTPLEPDAPKDRIPSIIKPGELSEFEAQYWKSRSVVGYVLSASCGYVR